jgi:hypothetical protein
MNFGEEAADERPWEALFTIPLNELIFDMAMGPGFEGRRWIT